MNRIDRRNFLRSSALATASLALGAQRIAWADSALLATTTSGKVSGLVADGVIVFKGIPYGGDTAKTRFKAPVPPAPWREVKECTHFTTLAPQLMTARAAGTAAPRGPGNLGVQSEDCLHLNVWTAGLRDHHKRPVLVYFHGGAYNNGTVNSDLYDGTRLPGYPFFLAITGPDQHVYLAQLILGLVTTLLVFYIGWRVSHKGWFAAIAALAHALNLQQLFFEADLIRESLTTFFVILTLAGVVTLFYAG